MDNGGTVKELIQQRMGAFTPAERKVARTLIAAYPIAGLETMLELAGRARVSIASVVRFVTKLGFDGYPEFQRVLRAEVQDRIASPVTLYGSRSANDQREDVLVRGQTVFGCTVADTFSNVPASEFRATVDLLVDPRRRVGCTGGRYSRLLAEYLAMHLNAVRPNTWVMNDHGLPRQDQLLDVGANDVLVVFDYRRYQLDTIDLARRARDRGAQIVLFTDPWLSPIAEFAHRVLPASVDAPSPFDSLVGPLALVETLIAAVGARLGEAGHRRMEELETARAGFGVVGQTLEPGLSRAALPARNGFAPARPRRGRGDSTE